MMADAEADRSSIARGLLNRVKSGDLEFEVAGEREVCTVADSAATVEVKVLDELFA
jgi:hypothetical protein